jgi:(R,R)-butanediol dehydrogenase/meso-butanediol dehydrogenase/diacetyl reductase
MSDGALVEPLAVGLHALNMARFQGGESVLILGAGSMALAIVYWARRLGASQITVASRSAHRREVVEAMGADRVVGFGETDLETFGTAAAPPDVVAECVGKPGMINTAVQLVRPGGTLISLGMCTDIEPLLPALCAFKDVRLFFPIAYSSAEFEQTTKALESGYIHPEIMVSEIISLDALPGKIEALRGGTKSLKVLVDPTLTN